MNVIHELMTLLNIGMTTALVVRREMVANGVDFDTVSVREFARQAREAYDTIQAVCEDIQRAS